MNLKFSNKEIEGILTVLPDNQVSFEDEMGNYNFPLAKSLKLKLTMGYDKHYIVKEGTCISDLIIPGFKYLFDNNLLKKDEIDALILVTQSPDYFMPPTSNILQGKLDLKQDMICLDINQGCAGFIVGLIQSFMLLEQQTIKKVALINADVLSRKVSKFDRNSNPLIGDGASITILRKSTKDQEIFCNIKMDGKGCDVLMIPAGGFRMPSNQNTAVLSEDIAGNKRSLDNLVMKGDEVFNFVQREVPPMITDLLAYAEIKKEDVDYFMFHQPNKFILSKLADKLEVPYSKMPNNIVENFGNSSGASIPTAICHNLGNTLEKSTSCICMAGFGVGLTWASMIMTLENLKFNKIIKI